MDEVIITHPHRDHLDDIFNFDALSPRVLVRPRHLTREDILAGNKPSDTAVIDKYLEIHGRYSAPLSAGDPNPEVPENNGGVHIKRFLSSSCPRVNLNNHSQVTLFSYANSRLLLPGDNETASWEALLKDDAFRSAVIGTDILVAPHHGRASAFSAELLDYLKPKLTIISDGPFCDTSATTSYGNKTSGWIVYRRGGGEEERKCVTTRNDGVIFVRFGMNPGEKRFINVQID